MATNKNRCWPGYTPVPGKRKNEEGSCRPKAESKMGSSEKEFRAKRRKQLAEWEKQNPDKSRSGARHLHGPQKQSQSRQKPTAQKSKVTAKGSPRKKAA